MKNYTIGLLFHNCSRRMKKGKLVKVYDSLKKWSCPNSNCKKTNLVAESLTSRGVKNAISKS